MTIAVIMQVNDGLVLGTDSASIIVGPDGHGKQAAYHVYFNADKIFNLIKGSPIGCITWGNGSIGNASIATLVKDFRKENQKSYNGNNIEVQSIANSFKDFISKKIKKEKVEGDLIGFIIAGYSKNLNTPEIYLMEAIDDKVKGPRQINKDEPVAITWRGDTENTTRLLLGMSQDMGKLLEDSGLNRNKIEEIIGNIKENMQLPIGVSAMPIQDAIDFVDFIIEFNCKLSKFTAGVQNIGGPIDLAVITKHEKFKWISRKHYFDKSLNNETEEG